MYVRPVQEYEGRENLGNSFDSLERRISELDGLGGKRNDGFSCLFRLDEF